MYSSSTAHITDDFAPVYRAVINFKFGWDIYNEHFEHVDPHYLYPPGGTLIMAPLGYLPEVASRNWFIFFNAVAIVLAAYFLLRLFDFTLTSVAAPALLLALFCTESVTNTLVFGNINGCHAPAGGAVLPLAARREPSATSGGRGSRSA